MKLENIKVQLKRCGSIEDIMDMILSFPTNRTIWRWIFVRFLAKSFSRFSLEGFRKFSPDVFPEIPTLGPEVPVQENLAKSFSRFLSRGGPDFRTGGFASEISGPPDIPGYATEVPAQAGSSGTKPRNFRPLVFPTASFWGEAINSPLSSPRAGCSLCSLVFLSPPLLLTL